jgi:integrase
MCLAASYGSMLTPPVNTAMQYRPSGRHKPSHVLKVNAILSSAYEIEVQRGNVGRNPCRLAAKPGLGQPELPSLTRAQIRAIMESAQTRRNAARWSVGLAVGTRQGETLGLRWTYLIGRCVVCERTAPAVECWADQDEPKCPACGGACLIEARVWSQLQRLTWRHGCQDVAACTESKHKRPYPPECPKAARRSGRRHFCVRAGEKGVCPPGCERHASTCPQRALPAGVIPVSGGLVLREIKERRRKTIPLPPELSGPLRVHWVAQCAERDAAANLWQDWDLIFCQADGRTVGRSARATTGRNGPTYSRRPGSHRGVHITRHSAATIAIDEGVALMIVQEMLGHSDIRVTRGYVHTASPLAHDAPARMGRALFGKEGKTPSTTKRVASRT